MAPLPPLNALRAFEAAGRLCSFTLAAEELHVTPGAISRQIKSLEACLGIQLFARGHREVRLTAESALYLAALSDAFKRMESATARLADTRRERPLRIMCSGNVASRWLFPQLRMFHTGHPQRHVMLTTSLTSTTDAFDSDITDLVIRLGNEPWPSNIVAHRLFDSELVPICSPKLLQEGPPLRQPADLARHTLLYSEIRPHAWGRWMEAAGGCAQIDLGQAQKFESSALAYEAAVEGLGVALGERELIGDDVRRGRLVTPIAFSQLQPEAYYLIYQRQPQPTARLKEFRDWILRQHAPARPAPRAVRNAQAAAS
ncbi:LysR substrate-binding domain-containing protein [Roseomonas sp. 18066]|uniref:LysR substrate-binding domain-containing protein n=1 Tax=Roseomonas sp. 18066 TaxID=2681412 RepID=UPI00135C85BC|nr:LysR substrate-binding domain-containing protein [Roseomonas sp. 18066]